MSFLKYFNMTFGAIGQIALIGLCGYIFTKIKAINEDGLRLISNGVVNLLFPCYIFVSLVKNFNFQTYPKWWLFPLISLFITLFGFCIGLFFCRIRKGYKKNEHEFISLITFQNSGYLPLMLVNLIFGSPEREHLTIIIFLFLLGFNFVFWSLAPYYLGIDKDRKIMIKNLFTPPVIAIITSLILIASRLSIVIPRVFLGAVEMFGNCALPLAILVVGGSLAMLSNRYGGQLMAILYLAAVKLIVLPLVCLVFIVLFRPSQEIAFLILLQGAMPSATSLSVVTRQHNIEEDIISLGIFWTHIIGLITIPVWLAILGSFSKLG